MKDFAPTCSLTELRAFVTRNLASAEPGSVSRSILGKGTALRLTEPRSIRVAWLRGAMRAALFRGVLTLAALAGTGPAFAGGTVTNLTQADLQAALAGGGTVLFAVSGTLTLTNTIAIVQDTVLDAHGFAVTLSGGGAVRVFQVATNVSFTVNGLTLADGRFVGATGADGDPPAPGQDGAGAAILNLAGTVNLTGCTLTNHFVQGGNAGRDFVSDARNNARGGSGLGAAIYNLGGAVNLANCLVAGNAAQGGQGSAQTVSFYLGIGDAGPAWGGALYSTGGSVSLQDVTLTDNSTTGGAAQPLVSYGNYGRAGDAAGGALFATNSTVYLVRSVVAHNAAVGTSVPYNGYPGSASGGAVFLSRGSLGFIQFCLFATNSARAGDNRVGSGGSAGGGAVFVSGELQVLDTTFSGNRCQGGIATTPGPGQGGAIYSPNTLTVARSTFDQNHAVGSPGANSASGGPGGVGEGGAIWSAGRLNVTNITCASNQATGGLGGFAASAWPGGAGRGGALWVSAGTAALVNVTLAGNQADGGRDARTGQPPAPSQGGGLGTTNGAVTVRGSIFANSANGGEVWGILTDAGYNLCSDSTANFSATGSLNNTAPLLSALGDNGGPAKTMALLAGSPARDAIPSGFPHTDQRGVVRPQGPAADIGAFEADFIDGPPSIVTQPSGRRVRWGTNVTFTVMANGSLPLFYQWQKDGTPIPGATNASLTLAGVQSADAGTYSVLVTNPFGGVPSGGALLTVEATPLILSQPQSVTATPGANVSLSVAADGPALTYQWWHDGNLVPDKTGSTLVITNMVPAALGSYYVVVSNFAGRATSAVATLMWNLAICDSFNPGANGLVQSFALQADGQILVGGGFTTLGGQSRASIGRLHADGSVDPAFDPGVGGYVNSLAVQPDGKVLVGGPFSTLGGQSRASIGQLNTDGSVDPAFDPGVGGYVNSLAMQPNGMVLVGGSFSTLGGQNRTDLGRLNADGSLDTSFNAGASYSYGMYSLAVQPDGRILVGGWFSRLGGLSRTNIGRLNTNGSVDPSFNPGADGPVQSLVVQANGRILVGGAFTRLSLQSRTNIGRFNADGSVDPTFGPGANGTVNALAVQADGKILVGGSFTLLGGQSLTNIGRLNADGSVDASFKPAVDGTVHSLAVQADGKVLVGGAFQMLAGQSRSHLGRLDNTGPATQSLSCDTATITWLRGGTAPEVWRTTFDLSTNGVDWAALGAGTRIAGGWQLRGLSLTSPAIVRARGFVTGGQYNGSSWFVETRAVTPPKLTVAGLGPGGFRFTFPSVAGVSYVTEFSADLATGVWTTLDQRTGAGALETVDDPSAGLGTRFYRVVTR